MNRRHLVTRLLWVQQKLATPISVRTLRPIHKRGGKALDRSEASGERWFEAELLRLKGEALLRLGDRDGAEASLLRAISVARGQGARLWELRAAASLARCWANRDEGRRARDLLAQVYDWFTEGFGTRDLQEAGALLDGLP